MKVAGHHVLDAGPREVFDAACDPATLLAVIPGCEAIEQVAPHEYQGSLVLRLPGVGATFRTFVRLVDADPPHAAGMEGRVEGPMGTIAGRADFGLTEVDDEPAHDGRPGAGSDGRSIASRTLLEYRGEAVIQGPLARLDSRFAESLANTLIAQGLQALNSHLIEASSTVAPASGRPSPREAPE